MRPEIDRGRLHSTWRASTALEVTHCDDSSSDSSWRPTNRYFFFLFCLQNIVNIMRLRPMPHRLPRRIAVTCDAISQNSAARIAE